MHVSASVWLPGQKTQGSGADISVACKIFKGEAGVSIDSTHTRLLTQTSVRKTDKY